MHGGRIFDTVGDAILAEFVSAVEAVRWPPTSRLRYAPETISCRLSNKLRHRSYRRRRAARK
jgi:class 3 adenylate cyclase